MWSWCPQMAIVYAEGGRGKWCLPAPLFLQGSPLDPCLSGSCSEISKSLSLLSAPGGSQTAGSMLDLHSHLICCLFKGGIPLPNTF